MASHGPSGEPRDAESDAESEAPGDPVLLRSRVDRVVSRENLGFLRRYLRSAHPAVSVQDAEDITTKVMTRIIGRINTGGWVPAADPGMIRGYLRNAVDWAVADHYRLARRTHENPVPNEVMHELVLTDNEAVAALGRAATTDGVRAALSEIRASGDVTLFLVVTYLLDHIQRTGQRPSNRQTGAACGISHTAVANALVRMRPYFEVVRETAEDG